MAAVNITCLLKGHNWNGCTCTRCGKVRNEGHDVDGCVGTCKICGRECDHPWMTVYEKNYGAMDYDSAGRPVNDFVVTLYKCAECGKLRKEARGDFMGDPAEYLVITDEEYQKFG